ncbi:MAG: phospholipase D family protein [Planctomycetes bacterium]|nr:phospholipase D family protein [Planctomycetota bacterium]
MTSFEPNDNFHVKVLLSSADLGEAFTSTVKWAKRIWMAYAWASGDESAAHMKALDVRKLERVALGVDFCQTDPAIIRKLRATGALRIIKIPNSVFHPKLLVAEGKAGWRALIGSSNFTGGGFARNTEANVLIQHHTGSQMWALIDFVDELWEGAFAHEPTDEWLADYERAYKQPRSSPKVPSFRQRTHAQPEKGQDLQVEWEAYFELIKDQDRRVTEYGYEVRVLPNPGDSYLREVEACQFAFHTHITGSFQQFADEDRKLIAGWPNFSSGYFGRMGGAGEFKAITGRRPEVVGEILDRLPLEGDVSLAQAAELLEELNGIKGCGMGGATRLLCMKRPDLFLPANGASYQRQKLFFGIKPDNPKKYMEILATIWRMPWFSPPEPASGLELRVWRARVAMLDALFYVPTSGSKPQGS